MGSSTQTVPRVGQYLYASCSAQDYGRIIAVGHDENAAPTIDIELYDYADMASASEAYEDMFPSPDLMYLEVPKNVVLILRNLQYGDLKNHDDGEVTIVCNTPGNGCFRCSKFFWLHDKPAYAPSTK